MKATDLKFAACCALAAALIAFVALAFNFWVVEGPYPGYKILTYPGIITASLFSEEINFWPKLGIMLTGQFTLCFLVILASRIVISKLKN